MKNIYRLDFLERWTLLILAGLHALVGFYYIGPWYISHSDKTSTGQSPSIIFFPNEAWLITWGWLLFLSSLVLIFLALKVRVNTKLLSAAILVNFLLRLYQQIGVTIIIESWLPPDYAPRLCVILLLGILWIKVRVNARVAK